MNQILKERFEQRMKTYRYDTEDTFYTYQRIEFDTVLEILESFGELRK